MFWPESVPVELGGGCPQDRSNPSEEMMYVLLLLAGLHWFLPGGGGNGEAAER